MRAREIGKNIIVNRDAVNELKRRAFKEMMKAGDEGRINEHYRLLGIIQALRWVKGDDDNLKIIRRD